MVIGKKLRDAIFGVIKEAHEEIEPEVKKDPMSWLDFQGPSAPIKNDLRAALFIMNYQVKYIEQVEDELHDAAIEIDQLRDENAAIRKKLKRRIL